MKAKKDLKLKELKDLRTLDLDGLKKELKETESRLFVLRMKLRTDELKQTHQMKFMKKYVAQLKGLINELSLKGN